MKKIYSLTQILSSMALFVCLSFMANGQATVTSTGANTPQLIPAGAACTGPSSGAMTDVTADVAGAANTLFGGSTVGQEYFISTVTLELNHSWPDDLDIFLSKDGVTLSLSEDNLSNDPNTCTAGGSDFTLIFDDNATQSITDYDFTWNANPGPTTAEGGLMNEAFAGIDINGTWTIEITDDVGGDVGALNSVEIVFEQAVELPCILTCSPDLIVPNDAGECGAQVTVVAPTASAGCVTTILDGCTEFEGEADLMFDGNQAQSGLIMSSVSITGVPTMLPAAATSVDIEVCITGDVAGSEDDLVELLDENGVVVDTLGDELGIDCQEFCTTLTVTAADYATLAADGTITYSVNANPNVNPICASQFLSASVCVPIEVMVPALITNDFAGDEDDTDADASGFFPVGTTIVTFTSQNSLGIASTCEVSVTVEDTEAPTLTCPADQTINLDAGECAAVVDYTVGLFENCPVDASAQTVGMAPTTGIIGGQSGVMFDVRNENGIPKQVTGMNFVLSSGFFGGTGPVEVSFFGTTGNTYNGVEFDVDYFASNASWEFLGTTTVTANGLGTTTEVLMPTPFELGANSCRGIHVITNQGFGGGPIGYYFSFQGIPNSFSDGNVTAYPGLGFTAPGVGVTFGASSGAACGPSTNYRAFSGSLIYENAVSAEPILVSGIPSGMEFPIGTTTNTFEFVDSEGNVGSCSFDVTVAPFPEDLVNTTLACNDDINISVNEDCGVLFSSDMFLEGGPYGCYDDYVVRVVPFGDENSDFDADGLSVNNVEVDFSTLLGTHVYEVSDPNTGNACWGYFTVEDKFDPTIECEDLFVDCTTDISLGNFTPGGEREYTREVNIALPIPTPNTQTSSFNAPYSGTVTNVEVDVDINHTWISDLTIELTSPSGTTVTLFDQQCFIEDDIVCTFQDGAAIFDCAASAVGNTYAPADALSAFNGEPAGGAWTVTVDDAFAFDGGSWNSYSVRMSTTGGTFPSATGIDNCGNATVDLISEEEIDGDCLDPFARQVVRTFVATDASGNESEECVQTITVERETLATLTLPANWDGLPGNNPALECSAAGTTGGFNLDGNVPSPFDNGLPTTNPNYLFGTGFPGGVGECGTIVSYFTDVVLPICDQTCATDFSSYKVVRKWTILDWCTGEVLEPTQIIKVVDTTAPEVAPLNPVTISTDIWGCGATYDLPAVSGTDNCSASSSLTVTYSSSAGTIIDRNNDGQITAGIDAIVFNDPAKTMPGAPVLLDIAVSDCCGNTTVITQEISIVDLVPPVVVGETTRTVTLSTDGVAKAFAEDFDDGSHDGCGPIEYFVKRMDNGGGCSSIDKHGVYLGTNPKRGHDVGANNIDDNTEFNEVVHFCCSDVGNTVMVQFMVCDDANMNGTIGDNGDNCNTSMVEVEVQDKLAPQIICPPSVTITCEDLAGYGGAAGLNAQNNEFLNNLFGAPVTGSTCGDTPTNTFSGAEACGAGTLFRTITVTGANGLTNSCTQIINVTAGPDNVLCAYRIGLDTENPVFAQLDNCNKERFEFGDTWYTNPFQPFPTFQPCSSTGNPFTHRATRWWSHHNPDAYNNPFNQCYDADFELNSDAQPALNINCDEGFAVPEVLIDINGLCTEAGISITVDTFAFAGDACRKYLVHYEVIDQCIFDENYVNQIGEIDPYNSNNGYFELYLEIDAFDNQAPTPTCDDVTVAAQSCTGYTGELSVTAEDNCTSPEFFAYQWRLDVGNNNSIDFPANGWVDKATVAPGDVILGGAALTEFPIGEHRVYWIISDGCGNDAACSQVITITGNEKEPTPYCFDGLAVAVMPANGEVELWAEDFDAGSFDNCGGDLTFTMIPEQDVDPDATPVEVYNSATPGWLFDCENYIVPQGGVTAILEVRVYVTDADGNWDYCTASLRIDDNFDVCPNSGTITFEATGTLKTEIGDDVATVDVTVDASYPEFPMTETVNGAYAFDLVQNVDYTITPERNDDHLNGISTLDLVLIQKHILGIDVLESPYQLIAADVNNNCSVDGTDIVQLRKLLLGKYANEQFPSNTSWRFVESDYNFVNPSAPCNFSEIADIFNLSADEVNNFVGVKVGDINGTAEANATMDAETRSGENLEFVVMDRAMTAGNTYTIEVLAKDFNEVFGFQYTMNLAGAEFVSVESGALNVTENNFGLTANNVLVSVDLANGATLADEAVLFTITVKATANVNVSEMLNINSSALRAEAYVGRTLEVMGSDIVFRTNEGELAATTFALFQNEPNPFNDVTVIGFELPTSSEATLTVYDVTGKVLYTKVDGYAKGYNTVTINREQLPATGVLYYKLENGENVATMKMIVLE